MGIVDRLGRVVIDKVAVVKDVASLTASSLVLVLSGGALRSRASKTVFMRQIYFTVFEALSIIFWIALIIGLIIVTESFDILPKLGEELLIGEILVLVVIRELGPLFSAVIVIARSGTAMASELGSMKMSREVSSLEVMGIDPHGYLVAPRVAGTALGVVVLTFYFEVVAVLGGFLLAGFEKRISFTVYARSVLEAMDFLDVGVTLLKSAVFGLIIGAVCTYSGLEVSGSITRIPQQTTRAVITSLELVFVVNAAVTLVLF
ncbi:MAG TPA: ABC transporter permease [Deltaproteobacteria bacterium]|nr:ABC transporter permease [Deltaproteobacteria bacterium]